MRDAKAGAENPVPRIEKPDRPGVDHIKAPQGETPAPVRPREHEKLTQRGAVFAVSWLAHDFPKSGRATAAHAVATRCGYGAFVVPRPDRDSHGPQQKPKRIGNARKACPRRAMPASG